MAQTPLPTTDRRAQLSRCAAELKLLIEGATPTAADRTNVRAPARNAAALTRIVSHLRASHRASVWLNTNPPRMAHLGVAVSCEAGGLNLFRAWVAKAESVLTTPDAAPAAATRRKTAGAA